MKNYIKHCLNDHKEDILKNSLKNCHVKWLHSIMFTNAWQKIRMFYTTSDHQLWYEQGDGLEEQSKKLWIHPHHCNITLASVIGSLYNLQAIESINWEIQLDRYKFQSHINSGNGWFELLKKNILLKTSKILEIAENTSHFMNAQQMHTVGVLPWQQVAWFVFEWEENKKHDEYCYSSEDLTQWSPEWLYQRYRDIDHIREELSDIWVF